MAAAEAGREGAQVQAAGGGGGGASGRREGDAREQRGAHGRGHGQGETQETRRKPNRGGEGEVGGRRDREEEVTVGGTEAVADGGTREVWPPVTAGVEGLVLREA